MVFYMIILFGLLFQNLNGQTLQEPELSSFFTSSDSRIVGGEPAPPGSAPHMVALLYGWLITTVFCGGSIISSKMVLTAAHCIDVMKTRDGGISSLFHGRVGSHRWDSGGQRIEFTGFKNHPEWDSKNILMDGGILFTKIELNDRVVPVALDFGRVDGGVESLVTGFGRLEHQGSVPAELQVLKVTTISGASCRFLVRLLTLGTVQINPDAEVCTLHSPGHGMCNGDSGSGLISIESRKQIGLVSWGFPCAVGAPDVFTRPSIMKEIITTALGDEIA